MRGGNQEEARTTGGNHGRRREGGGSQGGRREGLPEPMAGHNTAAAPLMLPPLAQVNQINSLGLAGRL